MPAAFYARIVNKVYGPLESDKLKSLVAAGKLTRDDFVSKDGKTGWTPAGNVKGLFPPAELMAAEKPQAIRTIVRPESTAVGQPAIPRAVPAPVQQPAVVYVQAPAAPAAPAPQQIVQTTVIVNTAKQGNTCATLAAGLGVLSLIAAFVPFLGLIVVPAAGLTLLLALFGFIIALGRGGTGIVGSLGGGLLAIIAIPLALASTFAGSVAAVQAVGDARQQAIQAAEQAARVETTPEPMPVAAAPAPQAEPAVITPVVASEPEPAADNSPAEPEPAAKPSRLRTWTSAGGRTIEAEYQGDVAGKIKLKKADGKVVTVPLEKLSPEDQEYIRNGQR